MDPSKELASALDSETFGKDGSFHLDKPVGSASISPCGRDVVLASRQGLHIIDLDSPYAPPRHLAHHTPWEVADVQWSPFAARDYWVVSTSNQKALVWNLGIVSGQSSVEHVLHGHQRAITDINFSAHHPDILATCAVDSYVHCWDIRHPAKPAMTFCDWFAGATQVKWNRQDSHVLASSHDKYLKIWDDRKGAYPLRSIAAHRTKIYGVDWDRLDAKSVATCSLDKTIKLWNLNTEDDVPTEVIHTPFPVWRARHTPFGSGLLALPQRGNHDLHLYNRKPSAQCQANDASEPIYQFSGHRDQVKEFLWRPRGTLTSIIDDREFQLVSWGTDKLLCLHGVSEGVLSKVGYRKGMQTKRMWNHTRRGAEYKTFRDEPTKPGDVNSDPGRAASHALPARSVFTAGYNISSLPFTSGYGSGGFMSSVVDNRTTSQGDMDPISWMRGVKIGKRAASLSGPPQCIEPILSSSLKATPAWDTFESLGEEITVSLNKFPKVKIEDIDVQRRRLTVSLSRPWALEKATMHIRCRFEFPVAYPKGAASLFTLERPSALSDEAASKISLEVAELANRFSSQQRNSLEAILRYLLGEHTLGEALKWLEKDEDEPDYSIYQTLISISDDDDDDDESFGEYAGPEANSLELSNPMILVNNAEYNVPSPRKCGASWAPNGRLVCFFPAKQEEASLLSQNPADNSRLQKGLSDLFEGFGRLQGITYRQKSAASTPTMVSSCESDDEDIEISSSESSGSSDGLALPTHHFMPTMPWNGPAAEFQEHVALNTLQRCIGVTRQPSTAASKANISVSIYDYSGMLPVREHLAQEYVHSGGHDSAVHNADVAKNHGYEDLAEAWAYAGLILEDKVPVEAHFKFNADVSFSIMTHQVFTPLRERDSAVDLSLDVREEPLQLKRGRPVQWAAHPFGRRWLVDSMFRYFEAQGDVQMLAMLACVFSEQSPLSQPRQDNRTLTYRQLDVRPMQDPDGARGYFASADVARSLNIFGESRLVAHTEPQRFPTVPHSATSSTGAAASDPSAFLSENATSPSCKPMRNSCDCRDSHATNLSTSLEHHRQIKRVSSNISAFATSLPRPSQTTHSAASSPPNVQPKKRTSPTGSYLGPTQSSNAWAPSSWVSRGSLVLEESKSTCPVSIPDTGADIQGTILTTAAKPSLSLTLKNQDQFHNEGYAKMSLLDPAQETKHRAWQEAYAQYLDIWDMPVAMAEVRKYNCILPPTTSSEQPVTLDEIWPTGSLQAHSGENAIGLANHCETCSAILPSLDESPSKKCLPCGHLKKPPVCTYCNTYILGLSAPCLNCGHTMHFACRTEVTSSGLFDECITGCGCVCSEHDIVHMPIPEPHQQPHNRNISKDSDPSPAITVMEESPDLIRTNKQAQAGWEDAAYISLARNLNGKRKDSRRSLRMKGSQIWKGI
ncbi:MAG: hypothetical protein Q9163_005155 [Psora crenata]